MTLDEAQVAVLRAHAADRIGRGAILAAAFAVAAAVVLGFRVHPLAGAALGVPGVALIGAIVIARLRPWLDARRAEGVRLDGPWLLLRSELDQAGREPPKALWSARAPGVRGAIAVPPEVGAEVDPVGRQRLEARRSTGEWPAPGRLAVTEMPRTDAVVLARRSRVLLAAVT